MNPSRPIVLILVGFVCVLLGAIIPFLMVMHYLKSTFFLNFFSYTISVIGLILGILGSTFLVRLHRKKQDDGMSPLEPPQEHDQDW